MHRYQAGWAALREIFPINDYPFQVTAICANGEPAGNGNFAVTHYRITVDYDLPEQKHSDLLWWKLTYA